MRKLFLIMLLLALSISCLAIGKKKRAKMDSWLHHSKHELILKWGPPVRTTSDGADGEILIYCSTRYYDGNTFYNYRMFYANGSGEIYSWRISNDNVPPQQLNLNISRY